jgi:hypothetical protein
MNVAAAVETHLATWATIVVGGIAFAGLLRWLIVAALRPHLDAVHRRIDEHMRSEEEEAAEFRKAHELLAQATAATSQHVARLDDSVRLIERQLAHLAGKLGEPA